MNFLLDTNIISELRKKERCNKNVMTWISEVEAHRLYLSVLVTGEIRKGIEILRQRDLVQAQYLDQWLEQLLKQYAGRILPISNEITNCWGHLNTRRPLPVIDSLLAATAIIHDLTLVTRNTKDIGDTGVKLLNPFKIIT